jgi:hypothetical protein
MAILTKTLLIDIIGMKLEVVEKLLSTNATDDDLIKMLYSTPIKQLLEPEAIKRWEPPQNSNWCIADHIVDLLDHY